MVRITPIYKAFSWPFGRGPTTLSLGGLRITMVINHLLIGMIIQVHPGKKKNIEPENDALEDCFSFSRGSGVFSGSMLILGGVPTPNFRKNPFASTAKPWRATGAKNSRRETFKVSLLDPCKIRLHHFSPVIFEDSGVI